MKVRRVLMVSVGVALAAMVWREYPAITRYLKIRSM
ncbi:DUF6893 family small protein [Amycolatopsis pigmentata]|uniref:DUF6893 family small protein n=1 Tax=Amycolatopsis pigmentata TaxID=450801 RepID=A0ABW5FQJ3_9PSEU